MQGIHLRKYGVEAKIPFVLYEVDGVDLRVDGADAGSDCTIMKDEGAEATCDNDFVDEGMGYSITLTATEMEAARIVVYVVDSATKVWLDDAIIIETYGNASAMHAFDLDAVNRGTDNAALASVVGALADAAAAGEVTEADTLMQYIKQLLNVLIGSAGIAAFPSEAAPANAVSLAEVIRAIHVDVTGLNGSAMVGTNNANTTVPDAAGTAAGLHSTTDAILAHATHGLAALETLVDELETLLKDATYGLSALRTQGDAAWATATGFSTHNAAAVKTAIEAAGSHLTLIKAITDWQRSCSGTVVVNNPGTDTIFDLTAVTGTLSTNNDAYNNMQITFFDNSGSVFETRKVSDFVGASGRITVDAALSFPVQDGVDTFILWNRYSPTAAAGGGATAQEVHEYDVSGITTPGQAGYEIQQGGSHLST